MSITVIGTIFLDIKAFPFGKFIPDGRNPGYELQVHGGVARNIAEDLSNIGIETRLVSLADDSGLGTDVIRHLENKRVDTSYIQKDRTGMGKWIAVFDDTGDVAAQISVRAETERIADIIEENHFEIFNNTESIILEMDMDEKSIDKIVKYASDYKKKIYGVVSAMSITLERRKFFRYIDCFICNLQEASMLFNDDISSENIDLLMDYISEHLEETEFDKLIVTLGECGAVYAESNGNKGYIPAEDVVLVDSTGAGDAFCAGASAALSRGKSIAVACSIGSKLAADVITTTNNVCQDYNYDIFNLNK